LMDSVRYDSVFTFKYSARPNTPALGMEDAIPDAEKARRLAVVNERQKQIGSRRNQRHVGQVLEVMVEAQNPARGQWVGRTSQIKVMNFTVPAGVELAVGSYVRVRVTASFPNSLVGEMVVPAGAKAPDLSGSNGAAEAAPLQRTSAKEPSTI
jgi:tRNA-2-methylthio-N6-dimethylallyladenosine synthase